MRTLVNSSFLPNVYIAATTREVTPAERFRLRMINVENVNYFANTHGSGVRTTF